MVPSIASYPAWKHRPSFALFCISISVLFALSLWFSASAVVPMIEQQWNVSSFWGSWLTGAVQIGFVAGALLSAILLLPDRYNPRTIFAVASILGALFNIFFALSHGLTAGITWRFFTGVALAGVYPVAVKLVSIWFESKRGLAIGILIGALTVGSALPHFVLAFLYTFSWKWIIFVSSVLSIIAAFLILWVLPDPPQKIKPTSSLSWSLVREVVTDPPVMFANYGYIGHMWELYAMWTWFPLFLHSSLVPYFNSSNLEFFSTIFSFLVIGVGGAFGCIFGGWLADKFGRTFSTILYMAISGGCAATVGLTYQRPYWITLTIGIIWGISVIADSAQFSAALTEIAKSESVGTALTFQMAVGFLTTVVSINLISVMDGHFGWRYGFSILALGPIVGIFAMYKLRKHPQSTRMAHGKR